MAAEFSDRIAAGIVRNIIRSSCLRWRECCSPRRRMISRCCSSPSNSSRSRFTCSPVFNAARLVSLEAGVKYLILGALSSAFMVFGIALIWGTTGKLNFTELAAVAPQFATTKSSCSACCSCWSASVSRSPRFRSRSGRRMFIKARRRRRPRFSPSVPRRRDLFCCCACCSPPFPAVTAHWANLLIVISGITILYGNLCAIAAAQSEAPARLFQHRARGLSAAGRGGVERERTVRR